MKNAAGSYGGGDGRGKESEKEKLGTGFYCDAHFSRILLNVPVVFCFFFVPQLLQYHFQDDSVIPFLSHQTPAIIIAFYLFQGQRLDGAVC